jgi:AcrR family transcriptional regulator
MPPRPNTATRKPGRPPASGIDQRERLLDAALVSFAEQGIAATSLRRLAGDNGLTPAMLNYYFGTKDRLVEAVIVERLLPVIAQLKRRLAASEAQDPVARVTAFVTGMHETIERHPWLPALWVREVLSDGGKLREAFVARIAPELPLPLTHSLAEAQGRGELNASLDPRLLFVSLIGLTMFPFAAAPIWRKVFSADDVDPEHMLKHTLALLTEGIGAS